MTDDAAMLSDEHVLQAFRVIGDRLDGGEPAPPLLTLRERLAGELLGDGQRVAATLAPAFSLVTHTGGPPSTIAGRVMVDGISRQGNAGVMLWAELDDLLVETEVAAGDGLLHTFHPEPGSITSYPFAFFIHYAGDLMESEVAFLDASAAVTTSLPHGARPSVEHLRSLLDFQGTSHITVE
jgi:hypothetical protein